MSNNTAFQVGDLVWAKMKGYSQWPAIIDEPPTELGQKKTDLKRSWVFFFGSNNHAWIDDHNIKPYLKYKKELSGSSKSAWFKKAVEAIEAYIAEKDAPKESAEKISSLFVPVKMEEKDKRDSKRMSVDMAPSPAAKRNKKSEPEASTSKATNVDVSNTLKLKITPSKLSFGFLGLGFMGCAIVKNLIKTGHKVVVWNRTLSKCCQFQDMGVEVRLTPADVVNTVDITFSCVSDPEAVKDLLWGNDGVLRATSLTGKGYVEMSAIDPETSQGISEQITGRLGRYLEAQLQGSKAQAEEGKLIVLAAGNRSLFEDCMSCFAAIGRNSFYLGDAGYASKMNLVVQMMSGLTVAALAESMALAESAGLQQKDVLEFLEITNIASSKLIEQSNAIIKGDFPASLPLAHAQKDLKLALSMSEELEQPLPLAATVNEMYKFAKRLEYGENDVCAIYQTVTPHAEDKKTRKPNLDP